MDKNFYNGFEKKAFAGGVMNTLKAGLNTVRNAAKSSGVSASARSLGRNIRRGNWQKARGSAGMLARSASRMGRQAYNRSMPQVKSMFNTARTSATNLMGK